MFIAGRISKLLLAAVLACASVAVFQVRASPLNIAAFPYVSMGEFHPGLWFDFRMRVIALCAM